ncbi:hypothetical protein BDR04DRAFT_298510 [Suillus decipiens]|nr:hypothetical protein BDR04DRAFT_298510 [Suillus decipiens]
MHNHLARIPSCSSFPRRRTHMPSLQFPTLHNRTPHRPTPSIYHTRPTANASYQIHPEAQHTDMVIVYSSRPFYLVHGHFTVLIIAPMYSVHARTVQLVQIHYLYHGFPLGTLSLLIIYYYVTCVTWQVGALYHFPRLSTPVPNFLCSLVCAFRLSSAHYTNPRCLDAPQRHIFLLQKAYPCPL